MILTIGERLRRGDDERLAGVNAERVHIFHVADGDAVVHAVTHDLVLDLLPAAEPLLDEDLRSV